MSYSKCKFLCQVLEGVIREGRYQCNIYRRHEELSFDQGLKVLFIEMTDRWCLEGK